MRKYTIEFKWAVIFVLMSLAWMFAERLAGLHDEHIAHHATYTNLVAIPAVTVYVLALLDKRKNYYGGYMSYLEGFLSGLVITLFVTVLTPITQYLTSTVVTPDYFANAIDYTVSEGLMSPREAASYFNLNNYIIQGLVGAPVMGLLTSAVVAIFTRSRKIRINLKA